VTVPEKHFTIDNIVTPEFSVAFDPAVYRLSAVKKAAYKFGHRCFVRIATQPDGHIQAVLRAKAPLNDPNDLAGDFCNEVLDQELREVVAEETEALRNIILAQAFSAASLTDEHADDADYRTDPKGICTAGPEQEQAASKGS